MGSGERCKLLSGVWGGAPAGSNFPENRLTKFRSVYTVTFLSPAKLSGPFAHFAAMDGGSSVRSDPAGYGHVHIFRPIADF